MVRPVNIKEWVISLFPVMIPAPVNEVTKMTKEGIELGSLSADEIAQFFLECGAFEGIETGNAAQTMYDMIHQTERAKRAFTMNDVEYASAQKFAEKHKNCHTKSAMSEKFEYSFIPGGIGTCVSIKCLICKEEENITDIDCW